MELKTMFRYELKDAEPSEEGLGERLVYAFTPDKKIMTMIKYLEDNLESVDDNYLQNLVVDVPIIKYSKMKEMIDATEFFVKGMKDVFQSISTKKDKTEINKLLQDFEKEMWKKFPGDKVSRLRNFDDSDEYKGKSLKELGYTKAILSSLIKRVTTVLNEQSDLLKLMKKYSGMMAAIKYGRENSNGSTTGFSLWFAKAVPKAYKFVHRLLFYLSRKLATKKS